MYLNQAANEPVSHTFVQAANRLIYLYDTLLQAASVPPSYTLVQAAKVTISYTRAIGQ